MYIYTHFFTLLYVFEFVTITCPLFKVKFSEILYYKKSTNFTFMNNMLSILFLNMNLDARFYFLNLF